jgi:rhodanese-related sulfurtransferase
LSVSEKKRKYLYAAIIIIAIGVFYYSQIYESENLGKYGDITVFEAKTLIEENPDLVILDVRTKSEYDEAHIEGAINIPVQELEERIDELSKIDNILIYCRTGNRSSQAVNILKSNGFTKFYHMNKGITGWNSAGYPTVQ